MRLPGRENAFVDPVKVTGYLLSRTHREGRHKAAFFLGFGFTIGALDLLIAALVRHADEHEVGEVENVPFGTKYIIDGPLRAPDGRCPWIRSVWIIEGADSAPRFVTAYPGPRSP